MPANLPHDYGYRSQCVSVNSAPMPKQPRRPPCPKCGMYAATGKVRPLAPPQTIEIACAGFGPATSKPTAAEQSTSPKNKLRRQARSVALLRRAAAPKCRSRHSASGASSRTSTTRPRWRRARLHSAGRGRSARHKGLKGNFGRITLTARRITEHR
jgi:hypothetical protein